MPDDPTLIVLRTGWPLSLRASAYRTFARLGFRIAIIDRPANPGLRIADTAIVADLRDDDAILRTIKERLGSARIAGIVTFNDAMLPMAATLASELGLPGLNPAAARRVGDKLQQRRCFAAAGLAVPETMEVDDAAAAAEAVAGLGDCVIKPADSTASGEVQHVQTPRAGAAAFETARGRSPTGRVLVESFIDGPEMTVETACIDGRHLLIGLTDTRTGGYPFFIELGHTAPSSVSNSAEVVAVVTRALDALGVDHGVICTEVKMTAAGPVIVEVNARPPGDAVMDILSLCLDYDLYQLVAELATGAAVRELPASFARSASIAFLPNPVGRVRTIDVRDPVLPVAPPWLVDFAVWPRVGDLLGPARSNAGRAGYAIAVAADPETAAHRASWAVGAIRITVDG